MGTTAESRGLVKPQNVEAAAEAQQVVRDHLEEFARQGAQKMLTQALEEEVDAYLQRGRYQRRRPQGDDAPDAEIEDQPVDPPVFRGYRNGSTPRTLTLGSGSFRLDQPRVRDIPEGQAPFQSKILRPYQRRSDLISQTFMELFIEGLATRDFEPSLRLLVGSEAPLSASTISRLNQQFKQEYEAFEQHDLSQHTFVYIWADGIYLKAGLGQEKVCLMILIAADTQGRKHLIGLREGYRESAQSWGELIADCRRRGLNEPACWIADGALGLWAAVNEQCPQSAQQRCTNHKMRNVLDKLPKRERPEYTKRLRAVWGASDEAAARKLAVTLIADLKKADYERAARCLEDDLDRCLTFFQFPEPHWRHLRTTNVIESPFATVRLRTNAAKRFKKTKSGVYLVYQVMDRLQRNWHHLQSAHLCTTIPLPPAPSEQKRASA